MNLDGAYSENTKVDHVILSVVKEGHYIASELRQQPYIGLGGSFHHAPLLLLLGPLTTSPPWISHLIWTVTEAATAWLLADLAYKRKRDLLKGEQVWTAEKVAAMSVSRTGRCVP